MKKVSIYIPEETHVELKHKAVDNKTSVTELLRQLINKYLRVKP